MKLACCLPLSALVAFALVAAPQNSFAKAPPSPADRPSAAEQAIRRALDSPAKESSADTTLADFAAYLEAEYQIPVRLDCKALSESGIAPDTPLDAAEIDGVRLRTALELALRPLELTWTIYDDVLLITTQSEAENLLVVKVYDVENLIGRRDSRYYGDYQALIELLTTTLAPTSWDEVGGPAAIQEYQHAGRAAIVVSQTPQVHEEIAALLLALRTVGGSSDAESPQVASPHSLSDTLKPSRAKSSRQRSRVYQASTWMIPSANP
ncbi:MAG TPA: hypothetical protein VHB99_16380 [Pirellulales bacterium]|nr:hypothetical protein [Pirellulales bacterium]